MKRIVPLTAALATLALSGCVTVVVSDGHGGPPTARQRVVVRQQAPVPPWVQGGQRDCVWQQVLVPHGGGQRQAVCVPTR